MRIIGGLFKGHTLKAPKGDATRPTSSQLREALFNICRNELEGASVLDLCSGSGAVGIEAISRGAKLAVFVDKHPLALAALKENLTRLSVEGKIYKLDALKALNLLIKEGQSFDIIYADPPYEAEPKKSANERSLASQILQIVDQNSLLKPGGVLFIEEGGKFDRIEPLSTLIEQKPRTFGKSILHEFRHPEV